MFIAQALHLNTFKYDIYKHTFEIHFSIGVSPWLVLVAQRFRIQHAAATASAQNVCCGVPGMMYSMFLQILFALIRLRYHLANKKYFFHVNFPLCFYILGISG